MGKDKHRRMWAIYNPEGFSMAAPCHPIMFLMVNQGTCTTVLTSPSKMERALASDEQTEYCKTMLSGFGLQVIVGG